MPGSRKKPIPEKKRAGLWIPIVLAMMLAGVLLYLFWWPVSVGEAYDFSLTTDQMVLSIRDGVYEEQTPPYVLTPKSRLLEWRARKAFRAEKLIWSVSDPSVASVREGGTIAALEEGTAALQGRFGDLSVSCPLVVYYPLTGIRFSESALGPQKGESAVLTLSPVPAQAKLPESIVFSSSDDSIVHVSARGEIEALRVGDALITAEADGFKAECVVRVLSPMTDLRLEAGQESLNVGETLALDVFFEPQDTTDDRTLSWEISDPSLAAVDEAGVVTALNPGEVTLRGRAGSFEDEVSLRIFAPLSGISFAEEEVRLLKAETLPLALLFDPVNTTDDTTAVYESSDPATIRVDENGQITAVEGGEATITARVGEKEATCHVMVRVPMTGILIDGKNETLERGETTQRTLSFFPADTNDERTVTWVSDDPSVAEVDENGLITAVGAGETLITASCGEFSDKVRITVVVRVQEVKLSRERLDMKKGETAELSATVLPEDTTEDKTISWRSSDNSVATVSDGTVSAVGAGNCTITASCGGKSASCEVSVLAPLTGIGLNNTDFTLIAGDSYKLNLSYFPGDTTDDRTIRWTSSDPSVATVDGGGLVTGLSAGTCTVTAAVGNFTVSATVRVNPLIHVSSVSLSRSSYTFTVRGESMTLSTTVSPGNATYPNVRWSSSDSSVATVDGSGTVRVVANGSCTITATADGVSASCQITAALPPPPVVIILDPGHGGKWPGATALDGQKEADLNLATAKACRTYLVNNYNVTVWLTRAGNDDIFVWGDVDADIRARAQHAKNKEALILVSLHYNSGGGSGSMVYYSKETKTTDKSYALANSIINRIGAYGFKLSSNSVRYSYFDENNPADYYAIIRYGAEVGIPTVLVEHCFLDNAGDLASLDTTAYGYADALGIADYLINYLGLKIK